MRFFLLCCVFLLEFSHVRSASVPADIPIVTYLDVENGLSHNTVRCIYQDRKGFMWFGTRDGLNRYDGYGFKVFRNKFNDRNSLVHNIIHSITSDAEDHLWIGTRHGLSVYDEVFGKFTTIHYQSGDALKPLQAVIRDVLADPKGNMLIGAEELGLLYCKKGSFNASQIPLWYKGKKTFQYGVQSVRMTGGGQVWVFVQNLGLCRLDYGSMTLRLVNTTILLALCMAIDGEDIWIGTAGGLFAYDAKANQIRPVFGQEKSLNSKAVNSLYADHSHHLYIGTVSNGVYRYDPKERKLQNLLAGERNNSVRSGIVHAIYVDKGLRKWIGTSVGGLKLIDPNKKQFQTITHLPGDKNSLAGNDVSAFLEVGQDQLWIGTESSGLTLWNRRLGSFVNYRNIPGDKSSISSDVITFIKMDYKKEIWMGTFTEGLNRYHPSTNNFTRYQCIDPNTGIDSKVVFTLFEDRDKELWAGTLRRGSLLGALYRLNREKDKFELFDTRLTDLFTMVQDSRGVLWGGNLSQLVKIDKVGKHHQFFTVGYTVRAIYEEPNGDLWVGTEGGGLLLFDRKTSRIKNRYSTENGLSSNSVLSLLDDGKGNLWMTTYNGLIKFNRAKRTFKTFYQSDGLLANQFQVSAALVLRSGEMVVGGIKGFNIFHPDQILPSNNSPNLRLTGLRVNNVPFEQDNSYATKLEGNLISELKVPYDQAVFNFEFTALEYSAADKISYTYFMDGWDKGWNNSGNSRNAAYTHVDEGTYTFRVRSTNAEGVWGKQEIALKIIVLPPWYRSWWAYLFYLFAGVSLIQLYLLYRAKQTKLKYEVTIAKLDARREKAEFEVERAAHEKERLIAEKEKELNEKRLTFFTNVSHEFRTPLTLIINPVKDLIERLNSGKSEEFKDLNIIYRNARRMLSLVDQLLLFRKTDTGADEVTASRLNFYDLCKDVYLCFTQQANVKMISYDFVAGNTDLEVYGDRGKIEIVLFNLISNAMKYTPSLGSVKIELTETADEVLVSVSDTGYGIPEEEGDRIFDRFYQARRRDNHSKPGFGIGLYLAKQFVEAHSGTLSYRPNAGKGTIFLLKLRKGEAHLPPIVIAPGYEQEPVFLKELAPDEWLVQENEEEVDLDGELMSDKQSILIVDDESDIRAYIRNIFKSAYIIYEAENGDAGLQMAYTHLPDLVITDFKMEGLDGIEFCKKIKEDPALSYIPVILLTGSSSQDLKLNSLKGGADDYIAKPFEKDYLVARVANLLKNRNNLQSYFYNEITLQSNTIVISEEYKKFLDRCILTVEKHLNDPEFGIQSLANEIGMSHSNLYKRVKSISGQSVSAFIRFIRLRKAAEIMIHTSCNVNEAAFQTGFNDSKYFSKQFSRLFHLTPSEFIRKHRKSFNKKYKLKP